MTVTEEIQGRARDLIAKALEDGGLSAADAASAAADAVQAGAGMLDGGLSAAAWDSAAHPRAPAGGPAGGQFAPASTSQAPSNQKPVGEGESGTRVSDLQKRLNELGAKPPLKVDGQFGPKTLAAVRAFQQAHGLKVDGLVGPLTTAALRGKTPGKPASKSALSHHAPGKTAHHRAPKHPAGPPPKHVPSRHPADDLIKARTASAQRNLAGQMTDQELGSAAAVLNKRIDSYGTKTTGRNTVSVAPPGLRTAFAEVANEQARRERAARQRKKHAAAAEPAGLPSLVTIPDVELLAAGTWELSTGRQTFTRADLAHAVEAMNCPAVGAPVIKIGHRDDRFTPQPGQDGEPAIGHVTNMHTDQSGTKLRGDLAGMPGWLAAVTASAFPRRSIEGSYGFRCQVGHVHPFVITAVALLGVTAPGVGVLSGLPDIATLYGLTASTAETQAWRTEPLQAQEGRPMPVTEEDVRRAYYAAEGVPPSWWITELQMAPAQLIVSDGDGSLYRVPFRIAGSAVEFEDADPLASYEDLAASRGGGPVIVYGSAEMSRTFTVTGADGNAGWEMRDGKWVYDPDGDGDDDSSASTDTDHSHWDTSGKQIKHIPPNPQTGKGGSLKPAAAGGSVDNSPWDAAKAYANGSAASDPEAFFRAICAAQKTSGDPATQAGWALPYRYTPSSPPNAAGVRAALAALAGARGGVQGLKNPDAAKAKLQKIMASINPDYKAASGDDQEAGAGHELLGSFSEPHTHDHPHQAYSSQGGDNQHSHPHSHAGDNQHRHDHQAAAGTNREGGADVDLTDAQITSLKLSLGLGDDDELDGESMVTAAGQLREMADRKVAAGAPLPATVIAVEKSVWEATQRKVEAAERYRTRKENEERDTVIAAAVREGKFGPTRVEDWKRVWDNNGPEDTKRILASLPKNAVPVEDIGSPDGEDPDLLEEEFAQLFPRNAAPQQQG